MCVVNDALYLCADALPSNTNDTPLFIHTSTVAVFVFDISASIVIVPIGYDFFPFCEVTSSCVYIRVIIANHTSKKKQQKNNTIFPYTIHNVLATLRVDQSEKIYSNNVSYPILMFVLLFIGVSSNFPCVTEV